MTGAGTPSGAAETPGPDSRTLRLMRSAPIARIRRRLNSSKLIPGPVRVAIGGKVYMSADYRADPAGDVPLDGWHRPRVARRQRALRAHYGDYGQSPSGPGSDALIAAVTAAGDAAAVLEVGCGGAANAAVIRQAAPSAAYVGVDYSFAMVAGAQADFPELPVVNADATALPFADGAVPIVVDGGMLIHVPNWRAALAEEYRVARDHLVLHTVTTTDDPTRLIRKRAYGYWVPEVLFNAAELREELRRSRFAVVGTWPSIDYDLSDVLGIETRSESWLCCAAGCHDSPRRTDLA